MSSLRKMLRRWASIVRGLKNSCAPTSLEVAPLATNGAMCCSLAVSARERASSPSAHWVPLAGTGVDGVAAPAAESPSDSTG
jgi:hypothetical protein